MHILIFDIGFQEKVKIISYFQWFLHNFFTFYPKNPKRPNRQSANMANFVAFCIGFQKNIPLQNPPGGGRGVYGSSRSITAPSDSLRNLTFNRNAHCTQMSDQWPLGSLVFNVILLAVQVSFLESPRLFSFRKQKTKRARTKLRHEKAGKIIAKWNRPECTQYFFFENLIIHTIWIFFLYNLFTCIIIPSPPDRSRV